MRYTKALLFLVILAAPAAFPQKREYVELQREVATLQDQMRSMDGKIAALTELMRQTLDASNKANTSIAVLESGVKDRLTEQGTKLVGPVAGLSSKLDQMTTEFGQVRVSVDDMMGRMRKLEAQLVDLNNTMKVLQSRPEPPPGGGSAPGGTGAPASGGATPPAGMSARQVYDNALRDKQGGSLDLALSGFQEYLKWYGQTELAPNAQFYIGEIQYNKGDFPGAIEAFDAVLERYSENNKTPDAMYMKGLALWKVGQRTEAGKEFLNVIQKYPKSEVAPKAKEARKALGLSVPSAQAAPARKKRR
jgi:tol-pal system protein YbgF